MKVYYDTLPCIGFLSPNFNQNNDYFPFKQDIDPYISFLTLEEALHILFKKQNYKTWFPGKTKMESYIMFIQHLKSYRIINTPQKICEKLINTIAILHSKTNYINLLKSNKYPGFMDISHILIADTYCDTFVTSDNDFEFLFNNISTKNIRKLVILNNSDLSIKKEIDI